MNDLARRVQELVEKKARARDLLAQAQAASEKGRYDECRTCLRQAFQLDEYDPAFRKLVLGKLIDNAASAVPADWRQAETMVIEATSLQPDFAAPDGLLRAIADRKKDADVTECLAKAEKLRGEGDAGGALAEVEQGLRSYPNEDRLKKLRDKLAAQTARNAIAWWRNCAGSISRRRRPDRRRSRTAEEPRGRYCRREPERRRTGEPGGRDCRQPRTANQGAEA